eukprot:jgi/Chlat1/1596/Chrsp124S01856
MSTVFVRDGKIAAIEKLEANATAGWDASERVLDYGDAVVMPGLIDVHAHMNDPGRLEWEGFETGTMAAAAGGFSTIVDMPLNSVPVTTTPEAFQLKLDAAKGNIYVDTGFWGGLVPDNAENATLLESLLQAGVLGLKSFMVSSGINDFPATTEHHIAAALPLLSKYNMPILVHAEQIPTAIEDANATEAGFGILPDEFSASGDPAEYSTYLKERPAQWEKKAVHGLLHVALDAKQKGIVDSNNNGGRIHIVHLADSECVAPLKEAREAGAKISAETCPHYLFFSAENVERGNTLLKHFLLYHQDGVIELLSSDHSPSSPDLKLLDSGDFVHAWGGVSSLQVCLSATWTAARERGADDIALMAEWWARAPAALAGLSSKGELKVGNDADFAIWHPEREFKVVEEAYYHKHKTTPYLGKSLYGVVNSTFVRGQLVYAIGKGHSSMRCGNALLSYDRA